MIWWEGGGALGLNFSRGVAVNVAKIMPPLQYRIADDIMGV